MKFRQPPEITHGDRCGSPLRNKPGQFCKRYPVPGRKRCKIHGGATPRGIESPHYKTGITSRYLPAMLLEKMDQQKFNNPLDLLPELGILRGLLDTYLEQMQARHDSADEKDRVSFASEISIISELIHNISGVVDKIVKIRNDTALTASELKLVALKIAESTSRYIPDETIRGQFLKEIFTEAIPVGINEQSYIESEN